MNPHKATLKSPNADDLAMDLLPSSLANTGNTVYIRLLAASADKPQHKF